MSSFWVFLLGAALGALVSHAAHRVRHRSRVRIERQPPARLEGLDHAVGIELGNLAGAIEGHAQLLCEATEGPRRTHGPAAQLQASTRRLRLLSEKIRAAEQAPAVEADDLDLEALLRGVRAELERYPDRSLQIEVTAGGGSAAAWTARGDREALRLAILFLVHSLLEREPDARALGLRIGPGKDAHVELTVEVESGSAHDAPTAALAETAAANLVAAMQGELLLDSETGLRTRARIRLPAGAAAPAPADPLPHTPELREPHPFGGVLVYEPDTALRELIKAELKRAGRRAICCADVTAAESLFRATPERFELLVLDANSRSAEVRSLRAAALAEQPDLHLMLLGDATEHEPGPRQNHLAKPFGVRDLRSLFERVLGPPPPAAASAG